jgi:transmembrane sensor
VALQADLERLPGLRDLDVTALLAQSTRLGTPQNVVDFPMPSRLADTLPARRREIPWRALLLPAAALSLVAGLLWFTPLRQWWDVTHYQTEAGEQRSVSLRDGSQVQINVRSDLEVRVNSQTRDIELQDGEALFQVAHDPAHPFRVHTPDAVIEAKGTQFDVRVRNGKTVVVLIEGHVEVTPPRQKYGGTAVSTPTAIELDPGEAVTVVANASAALQPRHADVDAAMAWIHRRLVFDDTPLAAVVDEFNLYSVDAVVIDDPALRGIRISASFDAANPELFARSVAAAAALKVDRHSDGSWHIERP